VVRASHEAVAGDSESFEPRARTARKYGEGEIPDGLPVGRDDMFLFGFYRPIDLKQLSSKSHHEAIA